MTFVELLNRVRDRFGRDRLSRELDDELRFHQAMLERDGGNVSTQFGNRTYYREETRDMWTLGVVDDWMQDVRYAIRALIGRAPGFAASVIATLALGIGAATAIFSVVNGVVLEPLPFPRPDQIVRVFPLGATGERQSVSQPNFRDWAAHLHAFASLAIYHVPNKETITGLGAPVNANVATVSRSFFAVFGVHPELGRSFSDEETRYGGPRAAVVSDAFWRRKLDASRSAIGRRVTIDGQLYSIVGVMPRSLDYPAQTDVWIPIELFQPAAGRTTGGWRAIGRMRDGETLEQTTREVSELSRAMKQQYGDDTNMADATVGPLRDQIVGHVRTPLLVLLAASAVLLLIAIANAVNLLVARLALRQGELAVRVALGATRVRLAQQLLVEALTLSVAAGVLGGLLAMVGVNQMVRLDGANLPRAGDVHLDGRVLLFAAAVTVATALVLGLLAAWHAGRRDVRETLAANTRSSTGSRVGVRRALVVAQLASTVILLVAAGVLGRSFLHLMAVNPGFRVDHLLIVDAAPTLSGRPLDAFEQQLLARLRQQPGVVAVGGAIGVPLAGGAPDGTYLLLNSVDEAPAGYDAAVWKTPGRTGVANFARVEGQFFKAMGIPVLRGRTFDSRDTPTAPQVALVNTAFAKAAWHGADAIGKVVEFGNMDANMRAFTVVGVVADTHDDALATPATPTLYASQPQRLSGWAPTIVVQTVGDPEGVVGPARRIVRELDPTLAPEFRTMDHVVSSSVADRRFTLILILAFGGTALLLSTLGVYSVVSFLVAQRTQEIGIRVALGAQRSDVVRMVLGEGGRLAALGILVGVGGSMMLTRLLRGLVFGVSVTDPVAFVGVVVVLLVVALVAAAVPAQRAARVDPMDVIRAM